jgi:hypothetical protein
MVIFPGDLTGLSGKPGTSIALPIHNILKWYEESGGSWTLSTIQVVLFVVRSRVATVSTRTVI